MKQSSAFALLDNLTCHLPRLYFFDRFISTVLSNSSATSSNDLFANKKCQAFSLSLSNISRLKGKVGPLLHLLMI